jgi:hypothetical protein
MVYDNSIDLQFVIKYTEYRIIVIVIFYKVFTRELAF